MSGGSSGSRAAVRAMGAGIDKGQAMTEVPATSRRRDRGRAHRSTGPSLAPLPRLTNRWAPLEILTAEQVERILAAAYQVLEQAGLEIRSPAARGLYCRARAVVDEATQMVRLGRDIVEA